MDKTTLDSALYSHWADLATGIFGLLLVVGCGYIILQKRRSRTSTSASSEAKLVVAGGEFTIVGIPFEWFPLVVGAFLLFVPLLKRPSVNYKKVDERHTETIDPTGKVTGRVIEKGVVEGGVNYAAAADWSTAFDDSLRELDSKMQRLAGIAAAAEKGNVDVVQLSTALRELSLTTASSSVTIWRNWFLLEKSVYATAEKWDASGRDADSAKIKSELAEAKADLLSYLEQAVELGGHKESRDSTELGRSLPKIGTGNNTKLKQSLELLDETLTKAKGM